MPKASEELARWLDGDGEKTLGGLVETFEEKSFALLFVLLVGVPALPLPTGGATHVLEVIAMLLALQLIAGRDRIWLPRRWRGQRRAQRTGAAAVTGGAASGGRRPRPRRPCATTRRSPRTRGR